MNKRAGEHETKLPILFQELIIIEIFQKQGYKIIIN